MNNSPAITIVMPTLNTARFVKQAVESVVQQSFDNWQLLIMDAGSTDGTVEIIRQFNHPNICLVCEPDEGPPDAVWNAFERSQSKYFMTLCASDGFVDRDWLKHCNDAMEADPEISLVWGVPANCSEDGILGGPHPAFMQFLKRKTLAGRIANSLGARHRLRLPRFVRRRLRKRLGSDDVQKKQWLYYWLDTALIFPDLNLCCRREVYRTCMPPYIKGSKVPDNWYAFYLNFNKQGYLPFCIPCVANFGRTHAGQISQCRLEELISNEKKYRHEVWSYFMTLKSGHAVHRFRDGNGAVLEEWSLA